MPSSKKSKKSSAKKSKIVSKFKTVSIASNKGKTEKYIPKYEILNGPAFANVKLHLNKDQSILCDYSALSYMDSDTITKTKSTGGIWAGFKRKILTTASMFQTEYCASKDNNIINCASHLPGDILPMRVRPGEKLLIGPHGLLCYTSNLGLESKRRLKGFFVGEGIYQNEITNTSNADGMVWIASYGGHYVMDIKAGESYKIDAGLFLAAPSDIDYEISRIGNVKTMLLSGNSLLVMKFNGPCQIYLQGRSIESFNSYIRRHAPRGDNIDIDVGKKDVKFDNWF